MTQQRQPYPALTPGATYTEGINPTCGCVRQNQAQAQTCYLTRCIIDCEEAQLRLDLVFHKMGKLRETEFIRRLVEAPVITESINVRLISRLDILRVLILSD